MVNTALTDPFDRVKTYSIGFDRMFDRLLDDSLVTTTNYPPYNIVKMDETNYAIQIAVAGFGKDDIDVQYEDGVVTVKSVHDKDEAQREGVQHQGISKRQFSKSFSIADDVVVNGAELKDGLLRIAMERIVPEAKKARSITVK
mgnify:CR=1 FL=1